MSIRENRRHKERRSVIPFGDIMLPVIGLVAVGLLIVGVKLLFLSGDNYKLYTPLPIQQEEKEVPVLSVATPIAQPESSRQENDVPPPVLAVPVAAGDSTRERVKVESPRVSTPVAKPIVPPRPPEVKRPPVSAPSNSRWGVQIGSFTAKQSAETVRRQAESAGFKAVLSTGQVHGKTYFRITVPAGNSRSDAVTLSKTLGKAGFPVFIVAIQ